MSFQPDPKHLAEAAVKVAKANHYLVGLVFHGVEQPTFETASATHTILIDMENSGKIRGGIADRAFLLLEEAYGERLH